MWRQLYSLVLYLAMPGIIARLWWRGYREPVYRERMGERFGFYRTKASDAERRRSEKLAEAIPGARVPGRMSFAELAGLMRSSAFVVGVDTGLTHLAAALGIPVAALFIASDPVKTGAYGAASALNLGNVGSPPESREVLDALAGLKVL